MWIVCGVVCGLIVLSVLFKLFGWFTLDCLVGVVYFFCLTPWVLVGLVC